MSIWIHDYAPKDRSEIQGQDKAVDKLQEFISTYDKQKKKAMLLYGPPGAGKTSSIYAIARELDLEVIEVNASDFRTKDQLEQRIGPAMNQMSLFSKGKVILIDEVDGLSGTKDRGGIASISNLLKKSSFPVIMTTNDPFDKKFKTLRNNSEMAEFHSLNYLSVHNILKRIVEKEGIEYEDMALKLLARKAGGDSRAAINDLQILARQAGKVDKGSLDILTERDRPDNIYNAIMIVLKSTDPEVARNAFDNVDADMDQVFLWLDENIPKEYTKPEDLVRAYDMLSRADVFKGRIRRKQHWRFMAYIFPLLSMGIATAKDEKYKGFTKYSQTKRLLKIWQANMKYQKRKTIAEKIASATHTSTKAALRSSFPYIKEAFKDDTFSRQLTDELELSKEEVDWLRK